MDSNPDCEAETHQTVDVDENYDVISGEDWNNDNYDEENRDLQHAGTYPQDGESVETVFEDVSESVEVRLVLGND